MGKKQDRNYMDFIPICAPDKTWDLDENGTVVVKVENKGIYQWMAQKFFKRPRFTYISLEGLGNFIWQQMDGKLTIYDIGQLVKEKYGQEAEPLYERLSQYFQVLYRNHFIGYVTGQTKKKEIANNII